VNPRLRMRGALIGALVALTFGYTWQLVKAPALEDKAQASSTTANQALTKVSEVESQVNANAKALAEANARLVSLGKTPVAVPKPTPSTPPVQVDEFTAEEAAAVRLIVADQLSRQKVSVTQAEISQIARIAAQLVPKPADGKTPTAAQIQPVVTAAIAAYCTGDKCVGKPGSVGPEGDKGDKGEPGADAPKVTDEELLKAAQQALSAYCSLDSKPCEGPPGPTGKDGAQGDKGRGVTGVKCQDDGTWLFSYSDGSTDTVEGPCKVVLGPGN
jgi:hypothetical protein